MLIEASSLKHNDQILLHTCCGPCLHASLDAFANMHSSIKLFFYNPNIHPFEEYLRRRNTMLSYLKLNKSSFDVIEEEYYPVSYFDMVNGNYEKPERCRFCYRLRMIETAKKASEEGISYISTTIFSSPHQMHDIAVEEALRAAETFDLHVVHFEVSGKTYNEAVRNFKSLGLYSQNYCGCIFSEVERKTRGEMKWIP